MAAMASMARAWEAAPEMGERLSTVRAPIIDWISVVAWAMAVSNDCSAEFRSPATLAITSVLFM